MMRSGPTCADQTGRRARHQAAQRGVDAAAAGIAQQRGHAGGAGHPDLHRPGDAAGAQLSEPGQDALGRKRELAHDMDAQAVRGGGGDLLVERGLEPGGRNTAMALRIGADADLLDPSLPQASLLDHRQRIGEWPQSIDVAADHQQTVHIGLTVQAGEQVLQVGGSANAPRCDMDDGLQAGFAQQGGRGDQFGRFDRRHRREIDRCPRRQQFGQRGDFAGIRPCRLDREGAREILAHWRRTSCLRMILAENRFPFFGIMRYSRRWEITKDSS